jgi:hypothetical protein
MCTVSMVMTQGLEKTNWDSIRPMIWTDEVKRGPNIGPMLPASAPNFVSREEYEKLRVEMENLKIAIIKAQEEDERMGNPDCEMEDKVDLIKKIAALLGVDMGKALEGHKWK